ncbi:MAG: NAD-dependent epimerase/dehydratase family protein [Zestosphaera sp.]
MVLVTGASGFLGGHLVEELMRKGYSVRGMVRDPRKAQRLNGLGVEVSYGDLTVPETLPQAVRGVDAVVHLAAYYTFTGSRRLYKLVNVEGTRALAQASLKSGVRRFIFCSSTEAIGPVANPPGDEDTPPNPQFEYGWSKLRAEEIVRSLGNSGLEYTIIRPSGIYGPRNVDDVAYWFIMTVAKGGLFSKFTVGSGEHLVQFVHVRDVVQGFTLALEKPDVSVGQTYIISDERAHRYREVYEILSQILDREPPKHRINPTLAKVVLAFTELYDRVRGGGNLMYRMKIVDAVTTHRAYRIDKAKRELGYKPQYDLVKGLKETIKWYRDNGYI